MASFQSSRRPLVWVLIIGLVAGFLGGGLSSFWLSSQFYKPTASAPIQTAATEKKVYVEESQVIDTVKKVSPFVVSIIVSRDVPLFRQRPFSFDPFGDPDPFFNSPFSIQTPERDSKGAIKKESRKVGGGTGFIITQDGLVLTNQHVVNDTEAEYAIFLNNKQEYKGTVISRDPVNDIAIVQMKDDKGNKPNGLPVVSLGDSDQIQVGQRVIAIGNALAEYGNSVTTGVISAKGRQIVAGDPVGGQNENLVNLLQTDAAINPGNSGGPLVDLEGNVIGINTAMASGAQGIGFAIPIKDVLSTVDNIKKYGKIIRPFLGVRFMMLDEARAKALKIDVKNGALLVGDEAKGEFAVIPGSPADKAGLGMKDVILELDGQMLDPDHPLQTLVAKHQPGDTLNFKVWRSGKTLEIKVVLEEAK
ncbi:trypsin-like peptidase domain-containing protein [Candidatus Peregrinibacteria bacterium]|nr:trypsin-like peptidase domain-containing protein [Candidatus Peregrinibacteria bacterium]